MRMWIAVRFVVNNPVRDHPAITERDPHIALHQRNLRRLVQLTGQRHGEAARIPRPCRKNVQPDFAVLDRVPEPLGYPRHGGPLHRRFGHIRTLRLHVGAHQAQRVCECGMPESVLAHSGASSGRATSAWTMACALCVNDVVSVKVCDTMRTACR